MIASSSYTVGVPQADGRSYVKERHLLDDGRTIEFEYLAGSSVDPDAVMVERATRLNAELAANEAAAAEAANGSLPLTKYQFRQLRTQEERISCDKFEATYDSNPALTDEQIATIRTFLRDYAEAQEVRLTDPSTIAGVQLWESLGLIAPGRAEEILNA